MNIYTPSERSQRILSLFVVIDFDQTYLQKDSKKLGNRKISAFFSIIFLEKNTVEYSLIPSFRDTLVKC